MLSGWGQAGTRMGQIGLMWILSVCQLQSRKLLRLSLILSGLAITVRSQAFQIMSHSAVRTLYCICCSTVRETFRKIPRRWCRFEGQHHCVAVVWLGLHWGQIPFRRAWPVRRTLVTLDLTLLVFLSAFLPSCIQQLPIGPPGGPYVQTQIWSDSEVRQKLFS